jgi:hypothetical protein
MFGLKSVNKETETPGDSSHDEIESGGELGVVDELTERKLMRKLDK